MKRIYALVLLACGSPPPPPPPPGPPPMRPVPFTVEAQNLTTGDSLDVTALEGDHPACAAGANYTITGHYSMQSRNEVELVVSEKNGQSSEGEKVITRGSGDFSFTVKKISDGPFEISFLRVGGGSGVGSILVKCK